MKVVWKSGCRYPVPAQVAYDVVNDLYKQGKSTAQDLVDASRPDDSTLHKCFEWDDRKAAEAYRRKQANDIMNHFLLIPEDSKHEPVNAFFNLEQKGTVYEPIEVILRTPDKREALLEQAKREMISFKRKYSALEELATVFAAMDNAIMANGDRNDSGG